MNTRLRVALSIVLVPILLGILTSCATTASFEGEPEVIPVGVLLPLTGDLSISGESEWLAVQLAAKDINAFLEAEGAAFRLKLLKQDSATDPETALEGIQKLTDEGAQIVIGPDSSECVFRVLPWANWFNVIVISPASTAPTLSIEEDNLFRMTPDDTHQAKAITHKMWMDGKRVIIPVFRDDQYASDLVTAVKVNMTMLGGTVVRGERYNPNAKNYRRIASGLRREVKKAANQYGTSALAVYVVGFEEASILCRAARKHSALKAISWYGNESLAINNDMVADKDIGTFLVGRAFTCPQYYAEGPETDTVRSKLEEELGHAIETYTLAAYDALWLAARAYLQAGVNAKIGDLKDALKSESEGYTGVTGSTLMNSAGDRKRGDYHFWQVQDVNDEIKWVNIDSFTE